MIRVQDVGDGLTMGLTHDSNSDEGERVMTQIDWGANKQEVAFEAYKRLTEAHGCGPTTFILSHFHQDHYRGLRYASKHDKQNEVDFPVEKVLYPRLPDLEDKDLTQEFARALYSLAITFGDMSGSQQYDFIFAISDVSSSDIQHVNKLSKGDKFELGTEEYEVIWPPRKVDSKITNSRIRNAINKFNDACDEDRVLREVRELVEDMEGENFIYSKHRDSLSGGVESYKERMDYTLDNLDEVLNSHLDHLKDYKPKDITEEANKKLRNAANDVSLAFRDSDGENTPRDTFLFLGDLEKDQLEYLATQMMEEQRQDYRFVITPHHGTHWSCDMDNLECDVAIFSIGSKLIEKIEAGFTRIAGLHILTANNKDITAQRLHEKTFLTTLKGITGIYRI